MPNISIFLISAGLDIFGSIFNFIADYYLSGSAYSVLSGESIIFVAILSKIILKNNIKTSQIMGGFIAFLSVILADLG